MDTMYRVRLESPSGSQAREVTTIQPSEQAAVDLAVDQEHGLLAYEMPGKRFDRLHACAGGRLRALKGRDRADYQAHLLRRPYEVAEVTPVEPRVSDFVNAARVLSNDPAAWKRTLEQLKAQGIPLNAVTAFQFGPAWLGQIAGSGPFVWSSATIKCSLHTSSYTPAVDTHDFFNDITNEVTGTGYTSGGVTLGSKTSTYDTGSDQVRLDAADAQWTTSTITARYGAVWVDTGGASSTDPVLGYVDLGADVSSTAGVFQITWDATGIFTFDIT